MNARPDWPEIAATFPKIGQLHSYWSRLNDGLPAPREAFDPEAIKPLLPNLLMVEFEHNPFRVRYRLAGTWVDAQTGYQVTGRYLDEFAFDPLTEAVAYMMAAYEKVARGDVPFFVGVYEWRRPWPVPVRAPVGIFPLTLEGDLRQAVAIEDIYVPHPAHETRSWRDYVMLHESGGPGEFDDIQTYNG